MISDILKVLVLEDMPDDVALIERELHRSGLTFALRSVTTEEAYQAALRDDPPDVILADYTLPSYDGLTAMKIARERLPETPFLIVSGTLGHDFANECLKRGAAAYIPKSSMPLLGSAVENAVREAGARANAGGRAVCPAQESTVRMTVLLIEDNLHLRKTLTGILAPKCFTVISAKNGSDGIEAAKSEDVHIALVDLRLRDSSGLKVLEGVKKANPLIQTIVLTGNATLATAVEAANKGVFSFLQEPYGAEQVLDHVNRAAEARAAAKKIMSQNAELQRVNAELKALYDVSLAISNTLDREQLFPRILDTLEGMEIFKIERSAIFLVEEDRLRLACHKGFTRSAIERCGNLRSGDCLCGLAANKGELVLSKNSVKDPRHDRVYEGMSPHGHIIVPLKSAGVVAGVLCLYCAPELDIDIRVFHMLSLIGNEMGIAISNAQLYEAVKYTALHDPLTGLANRRLLEATLPQSIARAIRAGTGLSAILIDIDHFKKFNDTRGHVAGDRLLKELGKLLAGQTRKADLAVRYGGEEFLLLLHETSIKGAVIFAEQLRKTVERELDVTISLGVAEYSGTRMNDDEFIALADSALYRAKAKGRNRTEIDTRTGPAGSGQGAG